MSKATRSNALQALSILEGFMNPSQLGAIKQNFTGSEQQFFFDKAVELADRIKNMPVTYDQASKGDKAIAYLHYFQGGVDHYIYEKDSEDEQLQASAATHGFVFELGYLSLVDELKKGFELDMHFSPTSIGDLRAEYQIKESHCA
ncbi:MAG: hypothetical protein QM500_17770 [Methylococcales bacterium]